jgi:replication factor A1
MSDVNSLIQKVSDESKHTVDEIKAKIAERKEKTHGLLSDYGALYAVAKEYGVDISEDEIQFAPLGGIKPQNSVNLFGRVSMVYSPREFKRKDNTAGRFSSVVLVDKTGQTRVVLWNGNSEITKQLRVGDTLLVRNGFSKDNRGVIEVHAGNLTSLTVNPKNVATDLPEIEEKLNKISELKGDMDSVTLHCRVNSHFPPSEFKRNDGSTGRRASFIGQDSSGTVRVVLWGDNADVSVKDGDFVRVENAYTRLGLNSEVEVQAGSRSRVLLSDKTLDLPPLEATSKAGELKIGEIKPDVRGFSVVARVMRVYPPRDYSNGKMSSLIIADGSGSIRTVLWNEKSSIADELKEGDAIKITNAYSKANLSNEPEIHVGKYGEVLVTSGSDVPSMEELGNVAALDRKIADLDNNDRNVRIRGHVVDVNAERPLFYMTCSSCQKKVQNTGGDWFCDSCGSVEPKPNMILSLIVEDDSGNIRAVLFRDNAEKLAGMDVEEAMNLAGESQDDSAPGRRVREGLLNREVSFVGRVRFNEFGGQLEFMVDSLA